MREPGRTAKALTVSLYARLREKVSDSEELVTLRPGVPGVRLRSLVWALDDWDRRLR